MFSVILAAVDGSERSAKVVEVALALAARFDGVVHLFRAITVPPEFPPAAHVAPDELPGFMEREARRSLEALAAASRERIVVERPVDAAQPWRAILEAADRLGAHLIVIGSHGYGGWDRILGTNASRVVDHSERSVLVVHAPRTA